MEILQYLKDNYTNKNGNLNANKASFNWIRNNDSYLYDYINSYYPWVETMKEFKYCLENNITSKPKCYECESDNVSFQKQNNRYAEYCSMPCSRKSEKMWSKVKQTKKEKYGDETGFGSEEIKQKILNTNLEKYGTNVASRSEEVKSKIIETKRQMDYVDINEKREQTVLSKYGVSNYNYYKNNIDQSVVDICHDREYLYKLHHEDNKTLLQISKELDINFASIWRYFHLYEIPVKYDKTSSGLEKEVEHYINELNVYYKTSDRSLINPYELDIIIPDYKLAIEFDGLYWHSEFYKDKNYHLNKTQLCESQGYQLIHIFEDEWLEKPELVKKMLKHKLGLDNSIKIFARHCDVRLVDDRQFRTFIKDYHIQGVCNSSINLGLYCKDDLIACLSFKKLDDQGNYDLVRYATSMNVVGGFSKLLKAFQRQYEWKSIITFANRRLSQGGLYFKNGFEHAYNTKPNYSYVKKCYRYHRMKFQKHKLQNKLDQYDPKLSEHQNMLNNGYLRIYDCGHMKFKMEKEE